MKKRMMRVAVLAVFFSGSYALAQGDLIEEALLEHLLIACANDIGNYCSDVTPGDGRLLFCMAAYEDQISGQCIYALYQTASVLEALSEAISYIAQECGAEITALCSDVELGEGRVLACLAENEADVRLSCKTAISEVVN